MQKEWEKIQKELGKAPNKGDVPIQGPQEAEQSNRPGLLERLSAFGPQNRYAFAAMFIAIIIIAIWLRLGMVQYQGFFEPDGFFHYSVIRAAVANGFNVPLTLGISGWPQHNAVTEPVGLYLVTLLPYMVLQYAGVSYYTIMRLVPIAFGILDAVGAYFLARLLLKSRVLSLLAMLLVAVSSGDIARTAALIYRGDSFVTIFVIAALLLAYLVFRSEGRKRYACAAGSGVALSLAAVVWGGASFAFIVYLVALLLLVVYAFVADNKRLLEDGVLVAASLLLAYLLEHLYMSLYIIRGHPALSGTGFFVFYVPVALGAVLALVLLKRMDGIGLVRTWAKRVMLVACASVVVVVVMLIFFGSYLQDTASGGGILLSQNALLSTIQELQPPTYAFLWTSFGFQLYLAPIGVVLFLLLAGAVDPGRSAQESGTAGNHTVMVIAVIIYYMSAFFASYSIISFLPTANEQATVFTYMELIPIALALALPLLDRRIRATSGLRLGQRGMLAGFAILIGYLAVTFYLAINAQRFNSLVSVPLAIFSAYGVYAAWKLLYDGAGSIKVWVGTAAAVFVAVVLIYGIYITAVESMYTAPADGINTQFLQAMSWMKNNTAPNATVLAIWPDGSVVEGWANRTSLMDSVGGQTADIIFNYSDFLFSTDNSSKFLYQYGKPQYLIGREFWLQELGGIATEGNLSNTMRPEFGYINFNGYSEQQNSTYRAFIYTSINYTALLLVPSSSQAQSGSSVKAYIKCNKPCQGGSESFQLMKNVMFYNSSDGNYSEISSPSNTAVNLTLLILYNGTRTISAAVLGSALPESNLFKIGLLCRIAGKCPYINPNVTLTPVYQNGDTTILKATYK